MILSRGDRVFIFNNINGIACLFFFSMLLSVKSGYSVGPLISLFAVLFTIKNININSLRKNEWLFILSMIASSLVWGYDFHSHELLDDYFAKYILVIFVFLSSIYFPVKKKFYISGILIGCTSAFCISIFQYQEVGRASGFTNAIRFGDLALWMAMVCWIFVVYSKLAFFSKSVILLISFLGFSASLLSLSRGGWLFFLLLPFLCLIFSDGWKKRCSIIFIGLLFVGISIFIAIKIPFIEQRVEEAKNEVIAYVDKKPGSAGSSVGARLEQWNLAWKMGVEKPWFGWGENGYLEGREKYVEKGMADPTVTKFGHPHNDFLNIFVKKGIFGVLGLLLVYIAPLVIFWPKRLNFKVSDKAWVGEYKAVCLIGITIPVSYFVFGLTEYFFYLNIGHIFYMFSIIYTYSLLKNVERMKNVG